MLAHSLLEWGRSEEFLILDLGLDYASSAIKLDLPVRSKVLTSSSTFGSRFC